MNFYFIRIFFCFLLIKLFYTAEEMKHFEIQSSYEHEQESSLRDKLKDLVCFVPNDYFTTKIIGKERILVIDKFKNYKEFNKKFCDKNKNIKKLISDLKEISLLSTFDQFKTITIDIIDNINTLLSKNKDNYIDLNVFKNSSINFIGVITKISNLINELLKVIKRLEKTYKKRKDTIYSKKRDNILNLNVIFLQELRKYKLFFLNKQSESKIVTDESEIKNKDIWCNYMTNITFLDSFDGPLFFYDKELTKHYLQRNEIKNEEEEKYELSIKLNYMVKGEFLINEEECSVDLKIFLQFINYFINSQLWITKKIQNFNIKVKKSDLYEIIFEMFEKNCLQNEFKEILYVTQSFQHEKTFFLDLKIISANLCKCIRYSSDDKSIMKKNLFYTLKMIKHLFLKEETEIKLHKNYYIFRISYEKIFNVKEALMYQISTYLCKKISEKNKNVYSIKEFKILIFDTEEDFCDKSDIFDDFDFTVISEEIYNIIHALIDGENKKTGINWSISNEKINKF